MTKHSEAGKGSGLRKMRDDDAYAKGYDRIFGKRKKEVEAERARENLRHVVDPVPEWEWPKDSYTNN